MGRQRFWLLVFAAVVGVSPAAAAEDGGTSEPPPSLEYRPPREVVPEPRVPTPAPPVTIFREAIGNFGIGTGAFDAPTDVVFDPDGNFYVLDSGNNRVQKFDRSSNFTLTWGSHGSRQNEFKQPGAIAIDASRPAVHYIFVVDTGNHRVQIFKFDKQSGQVSFFLSWGRLGSREGDFKDPRDLVLDDEGFIWVLDAGNDRVQKFEFDPDRMSGPTVSYLDGWGKSFGSRDGKFDDLVSIGWSRDRMRYIFLLGSGCQVQQFQLDGTLANSWPAVAPESGLCTPARLEIDNKNDYVYVLDAGNGLFERFSLAGQFLASLRGAERPFSGPLGLAVNPDRDEVLIADTGNNIVQKFTLR